MAPEEMDIAYYGSFVLSPEFPFSEIQRNNLRIIIGMFGEKQARSVLCQVRTYIPGCHDSPMYFLCSYNRIICKGNQMDLYCVGDKIITQVLLRQFCQL